MKSIEQKRRECEIGLYAWLKAGPQQNAYLQAEGASWTYAEAAAAAESAAARLDEGGVRRGDIVALRATRSADTVLLLHALHILGAVTALTDAHFPVRQYLQASGTDISPRFWLTNEAAGGGLSAAGGWQLYDAGFAPLRAVSLAAEPGHSDAWARARAAEIPVTDPSLIIFTSGSTGKSKAVLLCQRNYIANSVDGGDLFEECAQDSNILVLPLHHIFGVALVVCATVAGHGIWIPEDIRPASVFAALCERKISIVYGVPTFLLQLAEEAERLGRRLPDLRFALIAGGPSTQAQARRIEAALGTRLVPVYGMSEYVGICSYPFDSPSALRCRGVGTFYPLNEGWILRETGEEAAAGEEGEICVRGYCRFLEYCGDPDATAAAIDAEGRLHTGDLGYMDADGIVHITGRIKDLIIRGGENLSAGKIERAILSVEGVGQAVVVAVKDEKWGEVPCAAVTLRRGAALTAEEISAALVGRLSKHECPARIAVLRELPLTSSGKPDKLYLKEYFARS